MNGLIYIFSKYTAIVTSSVLRILRFHASSFPGKVALKIDRDFLTNASSKVKGPIVIVTGTDGKSSTVSTIAASLEGCGYHVAYNKCGSNLLAGIATAFLSIRSFDYAILECDESYLEIILKKFYKIDDILLLNLSDFDQPNRYGDQSVAILREKLIRCLKPYMQEKDTRLIYNYDNPPCRYIAEQITGRKISYGQTASDFQIQDIKRNNRRLSYHINGQCEAVILDYSYNIYPASEYQMYNSSAAAVLLELLQIPTMHTCLRIEKGTYMQGRLQRYTYKKHELWYVATKGASSFQSTIDMIFDGLEKCIVFFVISYTVDTLDPTDSVAWLKHVDFGCMQRENTNKIYVASVNAKSLYDILKNHQIPSQIISSYSMFTVIDSLDAEWEKAPVYVIGYSGIYNGDIRVFNKRFFSKNADVISDIRYTNRQFADILTDIAKNKKTLYVMGGWGAVLNQENKKRFIDGYESNRDIKRQQAILNASDDTFAFDCFCLIKGILWGWTGNLLDHNGGAIYESNGVRDVNMRTFWKNCHHKSFDFHHISIGEIVYLREGHTGVYIGDHKVVESTPKWKNGVQISTFEKNDPQFPYRKWDGHAKIPYINYTE